MQLIWLNKLFGSLSPKEWFLSFTNYLVNTFTLTPYFQICLKGKFLSILKVLIYLWIIICSCTLLSNKIEFLSWCLSPKTWRLWFQWKNHISGVDYSWVSSFLRLVVLLLSLILIYNISLLSNCTLVSKRSLTCIQFSFSFYSLSYSF